MSTAPIDSFTALINSCANLVSVLFSAIAVVISIMNGRKVVETQKTAETNGKSIGTLATSVTQVALQMPQELTQGPANASPQASGISAIKTQLWKAARTELLKAGTKVLDQCELDKSGCSPLADPSPISLAEPKKSQP